MTFSSTKRLRPYQVRLVTDVCRATEDVLVEQPTGSGKTVQIVTLVAMHLGKQFSHAVISAPQEQIEQGFVKREYQLISFPDCQGVAVPSIQAPKALIKGARESKLGSVKRVIQYLKQSGPLDHAFACTHAALNRLTPADLPSDLSGKALFIDEAHHASADGLSDLVALWRERGGRLYFFTATPYRGDGRPVKLEGMKSFRRSLAEHMAEGFAPRQLESEIVALGQPGDTITAAQFTGEEAPPSSYLEGLIAAIGKRWQDDGKPKAIVRVPPMQGGKSGELVSRLCETLAACGARVLDASGTGTADKQRFLTGLEAERNRTHATSSFDVMVGIQRVLEGTDWPVCSAVYCVGMPGSLNTVVQFLGRAMRQKGDDYPAEQRDRAKLVFFVPCGGGEALANLSIDHSRHALLTCCFLADHEVGQEWIVTQEVRRGIEAALGSRAENAAAADAENVADEPLDPEVRAEVELAIASAREQIVSTGGEPTLGEVVELTEKTRPDLPEAAVQRVATEVLAAQAGSTGTAARQAIHNEIAKRLRIDPKVKEAMTEAFAAVLSEFRNATLKDSAVFESVGRQIHGVTGGQMREFARRLREAVPRPLTQEMILAWADAHREATGEWPRVASGPVEGVPETTWLAVNFALMKGLRGLTAGTSLAKLLASERSARNKQDLPELSEEQLLVWADKHHTRTGAWPRKSSGEILDAPGETWQNVNAALRMGLRGLSANSSLAKILGVHRSVRNTNDFPNLSIEMVLVWADQHFARTREWPTSKSGPVLDAPGENWHAVSVAFALGRRGLPKGHSLPRLLASHRDVRNIGSLRELTEEQILSWADEHFERTGRWPGLDSGPQVDPPGESWKYIDAYLRQGLRGLPGGSSLPRLLAAHRSVRNPKGLPALSLEQILDWADLHFQRTGQWPNCASGSVAESAAESWKNIHAVLRKGNRGLKGGISLAQLLADHRGARTSTNRPGLGVEQILAWADEHFSQTGKWPTCKSGVIMANEDETWAGVEGALRNGARGLPGKSTLARLLNENRNRVPG